MTETAFINYVNQFGEHQKRSMFGGIGLFQNDAMFALLTGGCLFIRGGKSLDKKLKEIWEFCVVSQQPTRYIILKSVGNCKSFFIKK